jgi:hypothetical protein
MKLLATMFLALSLPGSQFAPPLRVPTDHAVRKAAHKGGQWYFAQTGHAVYCYGPVMMVKEPRGGVQRVATFCKGDKTMVPLKD